MSIRVRTTLVLFALALASATPVAAQHFASDEHLTELIRSRVQEERAVGIVLGVIDG